MCLSFVVWCVGVVFVGLFAASLLRVVCAVAVVVLQCRACVLCVLCVLWLTVPWNVRLPNVCLVNQRARPVSKVVYADCYQGMGSGFESQRDRNGVVCCMGIDFLLGK